MKYAVVTFGCRVNQADSLGFEEEFLARGGVAVAPEAADVVVVNTCSVTASADQAARQTVRRIARSNPDAKIVVTGCYATRRPDEVRELPNVIRLVPNDDKPRLLSLVDTDVAEGRVVGGRSVRLQPDLSTAERFGNGEGSCGAAIEPGVAGRTAFTLRVQTGCAEPCSYCIIPTTRGVPRSVPIDQVFAEVARVAAAGFKEIALTGVHLGSYGRDLSPGSSLIELLRELSAFITPLAGAPPPARSKTSRSSVDSRARVTADTAVLFRISSLEPMDCSRDIVDLVATSECFAPHFHLPLQHASNKVLAAMRRPYTIEQYASLVDEIRARLPHAAIGSDIIVGFPGETDEEFGELATYLESSPLTHLHVFPYSDRPGTVASTLGGRAHGSVVRERARRIREIGHGLSTAFRQSQVGTVHRGLTLEDGSLVVTDNYLKLRIAPGRARNEWVRVRVKVTGATEAMTGEIW
jgi:threonylcarbamoyladenosine tRNA methylthiotransferase MtaB